MYAIRSYYAVRTAQTVFWVYAGLVGGNLARGDSLSITTTVLGQCAPRNNFV